MLLVHIHIQNMTWLLLMYYECLVDSLDMLHHLGRIVRVDRIDILFGLHSLLYQDHIDHTHMHLVHWNTH